MYGFYTEPPFWIGSSKHFHNDLREQIDVMEKVNEPVITKTFNTFNLYVFKDGLIGFGFNQTNDINFEASMKLIDNMNALMFHIYNSINIHYQGKITMIDPFSLDDLSLLNIGEKGTGLGSRNQHISKSYLERFEKNRFFVRQVFFSIDEMNSIIDRFEMIIRNEHIWLFSFLNKIISHYKSHQFLEAYVDSFFLIEAMISSLWVEKINKNEYGLNRKRKDFLEGANLTLSKKLKILEMDGVLSEDLYRIISKLRKIRNGLVHDLIVKSKEILYSDQIFAEVFTVLNRLVKRLYDIDVRMEGSHNLNLLN